MLYLEALKIGRKYYTFRHTYKVLAYPLCQLSDCTTKIAL